MTTPPSTRLLHEAGGISVHHRPGRTDWTLVAFGPRQAPFQGDRWWGVGLGRREELDVIGVAATQYDWFPRDTMAALLPVIRAAAKPAIIAYGFSMGGYGALKYASAIGARGVLALSAQYSIDPADGTTGQRGMTYFDPARHRGMRVSPGDYPEGAILIWDPDMPSDDRHARAVARLPGIHAMPLRLSGHATAAIFAETGRLIPVAEALLDGRQADAVAGIRAARRESPTVLLAAAALLEARGHPRWAAEAQRRADARSVHPARAIEARARAFAHLGNDVQEIAALRAWQAALPDEFEPRLRLVERLIALGRPAEAAEAARDSIAAGITDDRLPMALEEAEAAARQQQPQPKRPAPRRTPPAARPAPELLGETDSIRLWLWPGSGPGALVIFTPPGAGPAGPVGWWAQGVARRLGWTTLVFAAHAPSWYPAAEMATLLPLALAALPAEPRATYGMGMGGHAALKHARALGAQATVALSPAWSIDPADMPNDTRARRRFDPQRNAGMAVRPADLAVLPIIAFDPLLAQDAAQARRLAAMHRVRAVPIHRGGPTLASILAEAGAIAPLLRAALDGDAVGAVARLRRARRDSATLRAARAKALEARGHRRWAEAVILPDAADANPPNAPAPNPSGATAPNLPGATAPNLPGATAPLESTLPTMGAARRFTIQARTLRLKQEHEAEAAILRQWIAAEPGALEPRLNLARCLQELGRGADAVDILHEARRAGLRDMTLDATLVRMLQAMGRADEAVAIAEATAAAAPRDAAASALLGEILLWAGRPAEAEAAALQALDAAPGHRAALLVLALIEPPPEGGVPGAGSHLATLIDALEAGPALEFDWLHAIHMLAHAGRHGSALLTVQAALRHQAPTMALLLHQGRALLRAEQADAALTCFETLIQMVPEDVHTWYGLTDALARLRRPADGRDAAARAAAQHPGDGIIAARHAGFLLELSDNGGAEREARRAIALVPDAEGCRMMLIEALWRQARTGDAIREAQAALASPAAGGHVALRLGLMLMHQKDAAGAAEAFARATEAPDPPREAWVGLAEALATAGRTDEAEAAARAGLLAQPDARALRGILGQLLLDRGEADAARDALAEAFEDGAGSPAVSLAMADACLRQGRRREALDLLAAAVESAPGHIEAELRLAQLLLEEGRADEAAALFTRVVEAAPEAAHAWAGLADAERLRKRVKPALEAYRRAVAAGADAITVRHLRYRLFGELEG